MNVKGSLSLLILDALSKGASYGYQIAKEIKTRSSDVLDFQEGTLYPALHKLEKEGLVEASLATVEGRQRRYYRLTEAGTRALAKERRAWATYVQAVNAVLGGMQ
ncbi:MAG: PadR family transcriptional regulator [Anaerolineae bacterium]